MHHESGHGICQQFCISIDAITKSAADSEYQNLMQKLASVVFGKRRAPFYFLQKRFALY